MALMRLVMLMCQSHDCNCNDDGRRDGDDVDDDEIGDDGDVAVVAERKRQSIEGEVEMVMFMLGVEVIPR